MPNGGVNYQDGILFCAQGSPLSGTGGIYYMPRGTVPKAMVTNFHGRDFNSVNDVVVAKDGAIWFTDPCYGHEQDFRQRPKLPCQVYRFEPDTGDLRVVVDGLGRPNGIAFSPDEETVYVTDTDHIHGDGGKDPLRYGLFYLPLNLANGNAGLQLSTPSMSPPYQAVLSLLTRDSSLSQQLAFPMASSAMSMVTCILAVEMVLKSGILLEHSSAGFWFLGVLRISALVRMGRCFFVLSRICGGCSWRERLKEHSLVFEMEEG